MTEPRSLTDTVAVAPQITPEDVPALAQAGYTTLIDNRPDEEVGPGVQAADIQAAAEAAGLAFVYNPMTRATLTRDTVDEQGEAIAASDGPVLAYCASGTRSAMLWALSQAGAMPTSDILARLEAAGYPMPGLEPQLTALAER